MTGKIVELGTRNKTTEPENALETDFKESASRGLRALVAAYEEFDHDDHE
jgi:hypothetical protein